MKRWIVILHTNLINTQFLRDFGRENVTASSLNSICSLEILAPSAIKYLIKDCTVCSGADAPAVIPITFLLLKLEISS